MKLLIVDDGHYVVEYMKHLVDWRSFGIHQIETTTNSIEAREMLNGSLIDILITDIRMPEVSGIDLLHHIHQNNLPTKVIILSGYSEFDYAQQGIRLGALDYLLKPVDKDDVEHAMSKAIQKIQNSRPVHSVNWEHFNGMGYLLSRLTQNETLKEEYDVYAACLGDHRYCFFKLEHYTEADVERVQHTVAEPSTSFVWTSGSHLVACIPEETARRFAAEWNQAALSSTFAFTNRNETREHFYRFFLNENVSFGDFVELTALSSVESDSETIGNIIHTYERIANRKQKQIYLMEIITYIYLKDKNQDTTKIADWMFNRLQAPDKFGLVLIDMFSRIRINKQMSIQTIVDKVRKYIEDHLSHGLSLDELGKVAHLHPVYFSKLFKQETGENVSNYISRKRLEKASQLLQDSELRIADIAQMIGYRKIQYFIQLFKQEYGVTPYQYRRNMTHQ
ncbi:response regulator [Paenibacillus sp. ACRSA]|uniref:response regulator n=1 Tax=Paenibacillus sp. ACRSA TaxID=2918211 RepID=UPI001EF43959|nr:response regulator [Paenibacillus sp. ACRSA]MCG7376249.1 response regulator [Paenibacillus sp. ACRSA]